MNEELQKALTEILQGALSAKDFLLAELPDVIQQLLLWKFWEHFLYLIFGIFISIIFIWMAIKAAKWILKKGREDNEAIIFWVPYNIAILVASLLCGLFLNLKWLQIWIAPKVYLIEYVASLTK